MQSGSREAGQGSRPASNTQELADDKVQPAVQGFTLNMPGAVHSAGTERLGTLRHPAPNEHGALPRMPVPGHLSEHAAIAPSPTAAGAYAAIQGGAASGGLSAAQQLHFQQQAMLLQQQQQMHAALAGGNQQMAPQQLQALQMMLLLQRNQQLQAMQAQQQVGQARASSSGYGYAAGPRRSAESPPSKRQAVQVDAAQAQALAVAQFRQLAAQGAFTHMTGPQQNAVLQSLYSRAVSGAAAAGAHQASRGQMRVAIDKRNRAAYDTAGFLGVETTDTDHADEVVRRCEEISKALRQHLGKGGTAGDDRFGATDTDTSYDQVTQAQLIQACGDTARYLKPYQIVGVNFLMLLYRTQIGGAILADEMGLGKTAQLITYLGAIRQVDNDPGPHLVVVPASLLENWQRELRRWCPSIKSVVYYGKHRGVVRKRLNDLRARLRAGEEIDDDLEDLQDADVLADAAASERAAEAEAAAAEDVKDEDPLGLGIIHESDDEYDHKRDNAPDGGGHVPEQPPPKWDFNATLAPAPFNVMLTCYTLFERDSPEQRADRNFLESWRWSHLIMDEAHALKNRNAQRTTRLRRVANASRRRIMMTGTPLQNDLVELQNLMHFLLPQVFAAQGFEDFAEMLQGDETQVQKLTNRMKQLLGPFVLRRLKTEVAGQLTEKKHSTEFIEMTPEQSAMYEASVQSMRNQITGKAAAVVTEAEGQASVEKFLKVLGAKKINHMFTHLRKIAQHPLLIRHHYDDAKVEEIARKAFQLQLFSGNATLRRVLEELQAYSDYSLHAFCYNSGPEFASHRLTTTHLMSSAKFRFLADILPKLKAEGSRPLIFSQWTAVLDVVEWLMDELRLPYVRLDGSTAVDERLATVDKFNLGQEDVFAFLLSTRAGGQGLNLTGANTVILHDVDFNPQIDRQAEDRCHRLGQTKPVMVYRLVTKNTVDQNIYNLSQNKLKLDAAVLDGITSGRGARQKEGAQERQQMGFILHSLFAGRDDYEAMMAMPDEVEEAAAANKRKQDEEAGAKAQAVKGKGEAMTAEAAVKSEPQQQQQEQQEGVKAEPGQPIANGHSPVNPEAQQDPATEQQKEEEEEERPVDASADVAMESAGAPASVVGSAPSAPVPGSMDQNGFNFASGMEADAGLPPS